MVAAAPVLIEAALGRLLVALGVTVAGGAAIDQARKRKEEADNARTSPIAQTEAQTKAKEKCKECPPDKGPLVTRRWNMSDVSRAYQARITGFAPYTEWNFAGVDFDGFRSSACLLQEAKAKYDQFFDPEDGNPKFFFKIDGVIKIRRQASVQSMVVRQSSPTTLNWYFMEPISYRYFTRQFAAQRLAIRTLLQP
ncbi:restriction endonuclease fold toxin 5 domain-containing protein [Ralstonia sp. RL]|uniref:restriction endonuclease fold toxin 5 domain-containing protein n=1 Tax=Ralstonia sp. RL TaxID=1839756 RepID=UPI000ADA4D78|nr:restriction endonuclease fold toxin 5 domain-containing protein [Ralstonia sp. RL]